MGSCLAPASHTTSTGTHAEMRETTRVPLSSLSQGGMRAKKHQHRWAYLWGASIGLESRSRFDYFGTDEGAGMFAQLCLCARALTWS
jgi:hypothetical protein